MNERVGSTTYLLILDEILRKLILYGSMNCEFLDRPIMKKHLRLTITDPLVREAHLQIMQLVKRVNGHALFVGGCVRDWVLGLTPKDFDIEVYGVSPQRLLDILSSEFSLDLVGEAFGVIKLKGLPVDISLPRRESKRGLGLKGFDIYSDPLMSVEEALARRDFTINAMAWDSESQELYDPLGGRTDLEDNILRHTTERFKDDPLRVLRGMQFAGRFGLRGNPDTIVMSHEVLSEYHTLPIERIWGEWYKWASQSVLPSAGLRFLLQTEWIQMYPELQSLRECPQDSRFHPEGDVWTHTLLVTDEAAAIAKRDGLSQDEQAILVLAALCHDLGKPSTTASIDGRIRSRGHCDTVEIFQTFLARLGIPSGMVERIVALCRYHLTHIDFKDSLRHVRRLSVSLADAGETLAMLGRVVEADHSGRPPLPKEMPPNMKAMLDVAQSLGLQETRPRPLLSGQHLLELGYVPGPKVGEILRIVFEQQLNGDIQCLEDAKEWVRRNMQ